MNHSTPKQNSGLRTFSSALKLNCHRVLFAAMGAACFWGSFVGTPLMATALEARQATFDPSNFEAKPINRTFLTKQGTFQATGQSIWKSGTLFGWESAYMQNNLGDMDADGDIDGRDFLHLQRGQGSGSAMTPAAAALSTSPYLPGGPIFGGAKGNSINYTMLLGKEWGDKKFTAKVNGTQYVGQAFLAGLMHEGRLGLEANLKLDAGSLDVNYPFRSWFSAPMKANGGEMIKINTGFAATDGVSMNTAGPGADFKLDLVEDINITYGAGYDTGLTKTWTTSSQDNNKDHFNQGDWKDGSLFNRHRNDKTLFSTGGEQRQTLLHIGSGSPPISVPVGDWGEMAFQIPEVITTHDETLDTAGDLHTAATSGPWVSLEADIVKIAAKFFPELQVLSNETSVGPIDLSYSILAANLDVDLRLRQEYTFHAESIDVTMVEKNSSLEVSGQLGDDLLVHVPLLADELDWDVTLAMNGEFTNRTSLVLEGGFNYELLKAEADIPVLKDLELGPVLDGTLPWTAEIEIPVFEKTFAVQGFNTLEFDYRSTTVHPTSISTPRFPGISLSAVPEPNSICCAVVAMILLASSRSPRRQLVSL